MSTPPAGRRGSTAVVFAALVVFDAAAFVFLAPEVALVLAELSDLAEFDPDAEADVIDEPVTDAEAGFWVFEALGVAVAVAVAVALALPVLVAAAADSVSARLMTRPPMFSSVGGHGHAAVKVAN